MFFSLETVTEKIKINKEMTKSTDTDEMITENKKAAAKLDIKTKKVTNFEFKKNIRLLTAI